MLSRALFRRGSSRALGAGWGAVSGRGALSAGELARLARGLASVSSGERLVDDLLGLARVLLEEFRQLDVDRLLDEAAHPGIAKLRLRLTLELRHGELDGDHRGKTLPHVLALEVLFLLLQQPVLARVVVQRSGQRRLEAGKVRAALVRVDVVREREDGLDVRGIPL